MNREPETPSENKPQKDQKAEQRPSSSLFLRPWAWIALIAVGIVGALAFSGSISLDMLRLSGGTEKGSTVVATVDGAEITSTELDRRMIQQRRDTELGGGDLSYTETDAFRAQVLSVLINETLLLAAADEAGVSITDEELNTAMVRLKDRFPDEETYTQELAANSIDEELLRVQLRDSLIIQAYLADAVDSAGVSVSDEEVQALYDAAVAQQEDIPALADVRDQIEDQIRQRKLGRLVEQHIQSLREAADIENTLGA